MSREDIKHLPEASLERLARSSRGVAERDKDFWHLRACAQCTEAYEFLVQYFEERTALTGVPPSPAVLRLAASLSLPNVFSLHPYKPLPDMGSLHMNDHTIILAAETVNEETSRFVSEATFASEEAGAVVRVIKDRTEGKYLLHALAEREEVCSHVLLYIGSADGHMEIVGTNGEGKGEFKPKGSIEWGSAGVILKLPGLVVPLHHSLWEAQMQWGHNYSISLEQDEDDTAYLAITPLLDRLFSHAVIVLDDGTSMISPVISERCEIPRNAIGHARELRLFE